MFHRLIALAGIAQQNALDTVDSGCICCELALTGSPSEFSAALNEFFALRREAVVINYQALAIMANTPDQPFEPRVVRKRVQAA